MSTRKNDFYEFLLTARDEVRDGNHEMNWDLMVYETAYKMLGFPTPGPGQISFFNHHEEPADYDHEANLLAEAPQLDELPRFRIIDEYEADQWGWSEHWVYVLPKGQLFLRITLGEDLMLIRNPQPGLAAACEYCRTQLDVDYNGFAQFCSEECYDKLNKEMK